MACEDFPEIFREAERSRLMAKIHRNTEGGVLGFFTLELLAELVTSSPDFSDPSLAQIPVCARFLPRKISDRPGGLLVVSLEGSVKPTKLSWDGGSITGTLGAQVGKALGQGPAGLVRYPHP